MSRFEGQVAIVTGGGGEIGSGIATRMGAKKDEPQRVKISYNAVDHGLDPIGSCHAYGTILNARKMPRISLEQHSIAPLQPLAGPERVTHEKTSVKQHCFPKHGASLRHELDRTVVLENSHVAKLASN